MSKKKGEDSGELYTNKVWEVLCCLDAAEHRRLLKYLASPYFIQSRTLGRLCEILVEHIGQEKPGFDRKAVWRLLFPGEAFDDVNFRKACSDLLRQIEHFMAMEIITQDGSQMAIDTLDFVVRKKVEPLFNSALREARNKIEKNPYHSLDYHRNAYLIERQYYAMLKFDVKVNVRANLEAISHNLDIFYWIEKLKLYSSVLSQKRTVNYDYQLNFIDEILVYLQKMPLEEVPELAIYYYSFLTLQDEGNEEYYYRLKNLLQQYGAIMPQKEAIELFDSALHYCIGKANKGNRIFLQEYFELFDAAIQKNIFIENGEIAPWRFNNACGVALRLGNLDWAELFIENFKPFLPSDTRQNTYTFNLARVYLYQKKYEKVLKLLQNIEYEDLGYNLISKAILIITYYELEEYSALDSFTEAFRTFLSRHKSITHQRRKSYLNLIKYTRHLTRLTPGDKAEVQKLRDEITRNKATTVNHEWLLEKLDELR